MNKIKGYLQMFLKNTHKFFCFFFNSSFYVYLLLNIIIFTIGINLNLKNRDLSENI